MHIQPVVTTSNNTIKRPARAPVAGITTFKGITVAVSKAGGHVDDDGQLVVLKDEMINMFVVLI